MTIIPFLRMLGSVNQDLASRKKATGLIEDWRSFLDQESIELIRRKHDGFIGFLALDPVVDNELYEYLEVGALSSESGSGILILYCVNTIVDSMEVIDGEALQELFRFDHKENVAHKILEKMFDSEKPVSLPGLLVFDNVPDSKKSIYIPLSNPVYKSNVDCLRKILETLKGIPHGFNQKKSLLNKFAKALALAKVEYRRNSKKSFGEAMILAFRILMKAKSDLISIFG